MKSNEDKLGQILVFAIFIKKVRGFLEKTGGEEMVRWEGKGMQQGHRLRRYLREKGRREYIQDVYP